MVCGNFLMYRLTLYLNFVENVFCLCTQVMTATVNQIFVYYFHQYFHLVLDLIPCSFSPHCPTSHQPFRSFGGTISKAYTLNLLCLISAYFPSLLNLSYPSRRYGLLNLLTNFLNHRPHLLKRELLEILFLTV